MKLSMVLLDSCFLFAYFVKEDDFHSQAVKLAKNFADETVFCSFLVFQEFMTLVMSRLGSQAAIQIGSDLLNEDSAIHLTKLDQELFEESMALFKTLSPHRLSFVDFALIALSRHLGAEVLTFDEPLQKALKSA